MCRFAAILLAAALSCCAGESAPARQMVDLHNRLRAKHRLKPLTWSDQLAKAAQAWANTLLLTGKFVHNPRHRYGENLFEIRGGKAIAAEAFDSWASEAAEYDYRSNVCRGEPCGHYTQIVWRDTRRVGCAIAESPDRQVWVCEYDPPGNYVGMRPY